jgi:acyl-CoA thioesterase FadM
MLVAPPNVTRRLEMKYGRPVRPEMGTFTVKARLLQQSDQWLTFSAEVRGPDGELLARAKAVHWIIEPVQMGEEVAAT